MKKNIMKTVEYDKSVGLTLLCVGAGCVQCAVQEF